MRGRLGCWSVVAVTGLAGLFPNLCYLGHSPARPVRPLAPQPAPVCLEAWVRLRSYRGCPVLASGNGYRLGIYCFPGGCSGPAGSSNGALVFAGPFPGRAYISERPVPLGRWAHLAGLEGGPAWPANIANGATDGADGAALVSTTATSRTAPLPLRTPLPLSITEIQATPGAVAIDGVDVTAGRMSGGAAGSLALGYDPWEARLLAARAARAAMDAMAAIAARAAPAAPATDVAGTARRQRAADCAGIPGPPDGERGAWRSSRAWRSLPQVAAGRGTPRRLEPLAPSTLTRPEALRMPGSSGHGGITPRGWKILGSGLVLALGMAGAGLALRRRNGGAAIVGPLTRAEE